MRAADVLTHAAALVAGDRERTHGNKAANFANIAALWNAYLGDRLTRPIAAGEAALMMALLKIARTKTGAQNLDDYLDGAGYIACAAEILGHKGEQQ
jgi:hypothetical protein